MTANPDPFAALHEGVVPVAPDPAFAAALRARLEQALLGPLVPPPAPDLPAGGRMSLTPYLTVADASAAIAFYVDAFGAALRDEPYLMDDGRVGHAELDLGGTRLMLADEFPEAGLVGPLARGGVSQTQHLEVEDVDAVVARAVAAGAVLEREVADAPYGRTGVVVDPVGHRWMVQTPPGGVSAAPENGARHGDLAYVSIGLPDTERAKAFYGAVLGWAFHPGATPGGWGVDGVTPMTGLFGTAERREVVLCHRVDDLPSALERVREAGGAAGEPEDKPYGLLADCTDDAGDRFQLLQLR